MPDERYESQLVRLVMADASPEEIEDATTRWFGFLEIISRLARRQIGETHDSREIKGDDTLRR